MNTEQCIIGSVHVQQSAVLIQHQQGRYLLCLLYANQVIDHKINQSNIAMVTNDRRESSLRYAVIYLKFENLFYPSNCSILV